MTSKRRSLDRRRKSGGNAHTTDLFRRWHAMWEREDEIPEDGPEADAYAALSAELTRALRQPPWKSTPWTPPIALNRQHSC